MSPARITSGVLAGLVTSTCAALGTTRSAPPVPLVLSWQPDEPHWLLPNWVKKIGLMHRWKYANASFWPVGLPGLLTLGGLPSGLPPDPPHDVSTVSASKKRPRPVVLNA